jgi:hypothetical protein
VASAQLLDQQLFLDVDREGLFIATINNGGDAAFTTQCTGGSLASPIARLSRQVQSIAHSIAFRKRVLVPVFAVTPPGMTMTGSARR